MDNKFLKMFNLDGYLNDAKVFIENKFKELKLQVQDKLSKVVTFLIIFVFVLFFSLMLIAFLSLAIGFYLNTLFNSAFLGFLIMALVFLVFIAITILSKGWIYKKIRKISDLILDSHIED